MAVAYKSAGTGSTTEASGGDLAPTCPATVDANDILIGHVFYEGTSTTPDTPSGWTLLGGPYTIESAYRHWVFGKIAAGTEDGASISFGTPAVTTFRTGRIYSFSGWVNGTITQVVPAASFAHLSHATDPQMPTVTTTVAGGLAVACVAQADDNAQGDATGETGGDWTEAVAEYTQNATTPDTGLGLQTCTPTADPGTVTGGSISTFNDPCGVIGFEIRPETPFSAARAAIRTGIDSAQAEGTGWDARLTTIIPLANVARTSNTVVTITLAADASYDITAQETITATVPAAALQSGGPITATPTFTIAVVAGGGGANHAGPMIGHAFRKSKLFGLVN